MAEPSELTIRPYEARDREAVRHLCCETGFLGNPIDPVFEDRELFADYLTSYYTDHEPESAFLVEQDGEVKGYLLGSRRPFYQQFHGFFLNLSLFARGMIRYRSYRRETRDFIKWILGQSWREVPAAPRRTAHFHFNLLPEVQSIGGTRVLINAYFRHLKAHGEKSVFGQVVTFDNRRGARVFERYGFKVVAQREITKYRHLRSEPVYLTTIVKELTEEEFGSVRSTSN